MRRRRGALLVAFVVWLGHTPAAPSWTARSEAGSARAAASRMPEGPLPTAVVEPAGGSTVSITWSPPGGGAPVTGYEVRAEAADGTPRPIGGTCGGSVTATACRDEGVPEGQWRYSVTPRRFDWTGSPGPWSALVTVEAT